MTVTEKVAYIKGLVEGLALDETKPETKVIKAMLEALDEIALTVTDNEQRIDDLEGYCDELDEDLGLVEDVVYGDDEDEDDDDGVVYVECPHCGEQVCIDDDMDLDVIKCPACGEEFSCQASDED